MPVVIQVIHNNGMAIYVSIMCSLHILRVKNAYKRSPVV